MKAVVFVDVQNDFVKGGALAYGYPAESNTDKLIAFAKECRAKGYALYATQDTHYETRTQDPCRLENGSYGYLHTLEGKMLPVEHCIKGTKGHEVVDGLHRDEAGDVVIPYGRMIEKETFGSFDLIEKIDDDFAPESEDVDYGNSGEPLDEIILCGYCTSICVVSNALLLRASRPNTKITVRADLCGDIDEESHNAALKVMRNCQIEIANG